MNFTNFSVNSNSSRHEIESLFNKIFSPIKKELDPNLVGQLCLKLNNDLDGAQICLDFLLPKIQSNQEWESLIALYVLEACVKNCGERFHDLISRFRFLNEMIKLVSPKYLGNRTSEKVKKRCIEILYSWSEGLPNRPKIKEAYDMLKRQGIVNSDPVYVDKLVINVAPRPKNPIFEDDEKSKELARLLKSKNPHDLEQANRIIKNMVKQDEIKTEKISNRINELEHINNNIKLLNDMLLNYNSSTASESEKETIKYLYEQLERLRPNLIQLATDAEDNDDGIGEILKTNDQCEKLINQYKLMFLNQLTLNGNTNSSSKFTSVISQSNLDDVKLVNLLHNDDLNVQQKSSDSSKSYDPLKELQDLFSTPANTVEINVEINTTKKTDNFDDFLTLNDSNTHVTNNIQNLLSTINIQPQTTLIPSQLNTNQPTQSNYIMPKNLVQQTQNPKTPQLKALDDLNQLGKNLMEKSLNDPKIPLNAALTTNSDNTTTNQKEDYLFDMKNLSLKDLQTKMRSNSNNNNNNNNNNNQVEHESFNILNNLFIKLESIRPNTSIGAFELYDKNNLKIVIHFGKDSPNECINVCVLSVTSSNLNSMLKNFNFQAAVPKSMKIKLQPASRSDLPVYNPILPPTAITQVMLIANPNKEQIRLKYKLSYAFDDMHFNEPDDVKTLPNLN